MDEHREEEEEESDSDVRPVDAEARLGDEESDDRLRERVQPQRTRRVQVLEQPHAESRDNAGDRPPYPAEINHEGHEKVRPHAGDRDSIRHGRLEDQHGEEQEGVAKIFHSTPTESEGAASGTGVVGTEVLGTAVLGADTLGTGLGTGAWVTLSGTSDSTAGMRGPSPAPPGI